MNSNPAPTAAPEKNNTLKIVLIVLGGCLVVFIIIIALLGGMIFSGVNGAKDKAKDAKIKSDLSSERAAAAIWYDEHNTYQGLTINADIAQDIQSAGSHVFVQGLGKNTFVIYAELPAAKTMYCIDASGFGGEVKDISPSQMACQ